VSALVALCDRYNWRRVVLLHDDSTYGAGSATQFSTMASDLSVVAREIEVVLDLTFKTMSKTRPISPQDQPGLQAADWSRMAEVWGCPGPDSATAGAAWRRIWPN